jgi:hypothetical protein
MNLMHNQIADSIGSICVSVYKQIHSQVDERVLTCVQICIDSEDFQKCMLVGDAVRKQIRDQFKM